LKIAGVETEIELMHRKEETQGETIRAPGAITFKGQLFSEYMRALEEMKKGEGILKERGVVSIGACSIGNGRAAPLGVKFMGSAVKK